MEDLVDLIVTGESPTEISDAIKAVLYNKAAERIENSKPSIASAMFDEGPDAE